MLFTTKYAVPRQLKDRILELNIRKRQRQRNFSFGSRTLKIEGKQNTLFPEGPVIKCFVIPPDTNLEKNCKKLFT